MIITKMYFKSSKSAEIITILEGLNSTYTVQNNSMLATAH